MLRLADFFAALTILLVLATLGFGAAMQLELFEPGVQVFKTNETESGTGRNLYAPLSNGQQPNGFSFGNTRSWHMILTVALLLSLTMLAAALSESRT